MSKRTRTKQKIGIAVLAAGLCFALAIVLHGYFQRQRHYQMETERRPCVHAMRQILQAKAIWTIKHGLTEGPVDTNAMLEFTKDNRMPECPSGGSIAVGALGEDPKCEIHGPLLPAFNEN